MEFHPPPWEALDESPIPEGMSLSEYLTHRSEKHDYPHQRIAHVVPGYFVRRDRNWLYVDSRDWKTNDVTLTLIPVETPDQSVTLSYPDRKTIEAINQYPEDLSREVYWSQASPASWVDILVEDPETHDDPLAAALARTVEEIAVKYIASDRGPAIYERMDINGGHCGALVMDAFEQLEETGYDTDRLTSMYHGGMNVLHYWIRYETRDGEFFHFDVEAPWGVRDWENLPLAYRVPALRGGDPTEQRP